jgi:very-short-patch-repair endonuclease
MDGGIIRGQKIGSAFRERARNLRKTMTPTECRMWQALRSHRLRSFHFRRQQIIGSYIVDFFCSAARVVIELDGAIHREQMEYDQARDEYLCALGLKVLRFSNDDVRADMSRVLLIIAMVCDERSNKKV